MYRFVLFFSVCRRFRGLNSFEFFELSAGTEHVHSGGGPAGAPAQWLNPGPCKDVWAGGEGAERRTGNERAEPATVFYSTAPGKSLRARGADPTSPICGWRFGAAGETGCERPGRQSRGCGAETLMRTRRAVAGACPPSWERNGALTAAACQSFDRDGCYRSSQHGWPLSFRVILKQHVPVRFRRGPVLSASVSVNWARASGSSRSLLSSSPPPPPPCLSGKPARRMRVTMALISAYEQENTIKRLDCAL